MAVHEQLIAVEECINEVCDVELFHEGVSVRMWGHTTMLDGRVHYVTLLAGV